jgi:hypothetical protein
MDLLGKIKKEDLEILSKMNKIKDIRKYIVKNYYSDLDLNEIIFNYLKFRGINEMKRTPKKIDSDLLKKIKEDNTICKIEELNKYNYYNEGYIKGMDDGLKKGVEKAMCMFIKNNIQFDDLLKVDEYVELIRN